MTLFYSRIITSLKFLCLGTWATAVLCGQDLLNQSINSGGGWVSNSENSSFTIYGEVYQSAQVDIQSPIHTVDLNSTVSLEMIWVEPGTFMMGSPETEAGRGDDETQHEVTLTKGFYLGKYEVTQAQYEAVMAGNDDGLSPTPSYFNGYPNRPVEQVSWNDVQVFLERLNEQAAESLPAGWAYVLPTEAQWEYACRAGSESVYSWGNDINSSFLNFNGSEGRSSNEVGQYSPNPWGFNNMHGNVSEWVLDWYYEYPSVSVIDPANLEPSSSQSRIVRGGSFIQDGSGVRSAVRFGNGPSFKYESLGFRLAFKQITEPPANLNSVTELTVSENQPIGTIVGEFNATDPDGDAISYHLLSGEGDGNNSLFTLDQNGTLKTAAVLDYEAGETLTIRVQARDELNATVEGNFTVSLEDLFEDLDGDGIEDHLDEDMDGDGFTNDYENEIGSDAMDAEYTPLNYGLVAWYPFDGNASDMSGNGHDARQSSVEYKSDRFNKEQSSVYFQGSQFSFVELDTLPVQDIPFTLSMWLKPDDLHIQGAFDSAPSQQYVLRTQTSTQGVPIIEWWGNQHIPIPLETDLWFNLSATFEKTDDEIIFSAFKNGDLLESKAKPIDRILAWTTPKLGNLNNGSTGYVYNGQIDDFRIYNRALSEAEVRVFYDIEKPSEQTPSHTADLNSTVALEMIWVEPGTFTMGSPETEGGRGNDETQHEVTLTKGFYLAKYEVTQAQYEAVMTGNDYGVSATPSEYAGNPNRPVERVSWEDVQIFLKLLNESESSNIPPGWSYTLPAEDEWEYACRAGSTTAYSWGESITLGKANYYEDSLSYWNQSTVDVGQYLPNQWGFYDMHGNVIEWTDGISFVGPNDDPTLFELIEQRIYRGGAFNSTKDSIRSAYRFGLFPNNSGHQIGFRLAYKQITEPPVNLDSLTELSVSENQPIGIIVGGFNATDPEGDSITYHLVDGEGDENNTLFTLDTNGTLRSAEVFDFEQNQEFFIRVQAKDEFNATVEKQFPVTLLDLDDEKPVIVLNGDGNVTHEAGSLYQDVDARWSDNVDGEGIVIGIGEVNASAPGINTIVFDFTDQAGNQATQVTRTITVVDTTEPMIALIGDANLTLEAGSEYVDAGAFWSDLVDGNGTADANGTVDVNVPGIYEITYSFTDSNGNSAQPMVRTVQVIDTTGPVITLIGDKNVTHLAGLEYIDQGAVWDDLVDGRGLAEGNGAVNSYIPGLYPITYTAVDVAGNSAVPVVRKVYVVDTEAPVLTLLGFADVTHEAGIEYVDQGAVWNDLVDGNGTVDANGTVNVNVPGTYEITYSFTDSSGNQASPVVRIISVVDIKQPVITLNGDANLTHDLGFDYIDEGAIWNDLVDGNGTADANGSVDVNVPGTYTISYNFTDSSGNQATPVFRTIEVINKSPSDLNSTQVLSVLENQPIGTKLGQFSATDPDGDEFVFSLVSGVGDHDNSLFKLEQNGTLETAEILDFEESSTRSIHVQVHDLHGAFISEVFTISIINEEEDVGTNPPINLDTLSPLSVMENRQAGFSVGSFTASDPDGDELIFSLVEGEGDIDNPKFQLSKSGVLTTLQTFNFEDQEIQQVRLGVSDQHGGEISESFEVLIIDQNDFPTGLGASGSLSIQENQPFGTLVGLFSAFDEDGDKLTFSLVRGPGDRGNENFTITEDGMLLTATSFDFEEVNVQTIRVSADDGQGGSVSASFEVIILDQFENNAPTDLNTTGMPSVAENREVGTLVTMFNAFDRDGDELKFSLVGGVGGTDNSLFTLNENGTLDTAVMFDFEEAETRSIRVQVMDTHGESITESFTIRIIDHENESIILEASEFISNGIAGEIGKLKVSGRTDITFGLGQDETGAGAMHLFIVENDGTIILPEDARESTTFNLSVHISKDDELLDKQPVTIHIKIGEPEDFMDADTSDPTYHETALMIRDLAVVQEDWRNGHNPITAIENKVEGLFVTTAQPHGRKEKDSVVLSGVRGLGVEGVRNWNFMIDEVNSTSFRLRRFGRDEDGLYDGSLGEVVREVNGTSYQSSPNDFLLGPWTFGHLLGNMVSEKDDPIEFYKNFASQWNHVQTVNGWKSDQRVKTFESLFPAEVKGPNKVLRLTLANLPFRLLAIGNRIDLFHAKSMSKVDDAGEGRFVFTMTRPFELPQEDEVIWKVHQKTVDQGLFTLIFEYGQPAGDFATLAKWAKDWHSLQRENISSGFDFDDQYFLRLNELTDRFSKRGSHPSKPNGNPINQVRTNDFIGFTLWQMREFNLISKENAHEVKAHPDRVTTLMADGNIDIGLWTTTTKNNPMVGSNEVEESIEKPLARWINLRESHILSADVGPRAPEWMEGPVANEPGGFSYAFKSEKIRTNLARYKYSLSTCSGCHTGDTETGFQMVVSSGKNQRAHFAPFMVGNQKGGMKVVLDHINPRGERHEFFDLKAREEIARDILSVAQQVDAARLRLTRTEIKLDGAEAPSNAFVSGGIIGDWQYDLPSGREDNDFYILNSSTGELSIRGNGQVPPFGKGRIFIRARATDGTGVVIERPYSVWVLTPDESRQMEDLDPSIQPSDLPPLATPRPNRTH